MKVRIRTIKNNNYGSQRITFTIEFTYIIKQISLTDCSSGKEQSQGFVTLISVNSISFYQSIIIDTL